jgi:hypothetical protein
MKKVKSITNKISFGLAVLLTTLLNTAVTYANSVYAGRNPLFDTFDIFYLVILIGVIIVIFGFIALMLMKLIRKIIYEVNEIKNQKSLRKAKYNAIVKHYENRQQDKS